MTHVYIQVVASKCPHRINPVTDPQFGRPVLWTARKEAPHTANRQDKKSLHKSNTIVYEWLYGNNYRYIDESGSFEVHVESIECKMCHFAFYLKR